MDAANFKYDHAWGPIYGYIADEGVQRLLLPHTDKRARPYLLHSAPNIVRGRVLKQAIEAYFAGIRDPFRDIALDISEGTPFQRQVWCAAQDIPWGATCTYGELAQRMGMSPGAARAIGQALGANPVHIIIPCHRILPASGGCGGYAAGVRWKKELLRIEGVAME